MPKNDFAIWVTDNNGQIARPTDENDRGGGISTSAHIGQCHCASRREKGNGDNLSKSCTNMNCSPKTQPTLLSTMAKTDKMV